MLPDRARDAVLIEMPAAATSLPFSRMAQSAENAAQSQQSFLLMNSYHGDIEKERAFVTLVAQQRAAGVLLVGSRMPSDEYRRQVQENKEYMDAVVRVSFSYRCVELLRPADWFRPAGDCRCFYACVGNLMDGNRSC